VKSIENIAAVVTQEILNVLAEEEKQPQTEQG